MARYSFLWFLVQILVCVDWIYFYHVFLKDNNKNEFIKTTISIVVYYLFTFIAANFITSNTLLSFISFFVMFISIYLIRRPNIKQLIFSSIIYLVISLITETISMLIFLGLDYLFGIEEYLILFIFDYVCLTVVYIAIRMYKKENISLSTNILFVILLLVLNQENWLYLLSNILITNGPDDSLSIKIVILQLLVLGVVILLVRDYLKFKKIKLEAEVKERNKEELKRQINSLGNKQSILNTIYKQIQNDDLSIDKLDNLSKELKDIRMTLYSDNPSINALLSYFNNECLKENVKFVVEIKGSIKDRLDDYDLNILLNNVLKNALEASNNNIDLKIVSTDTNIIIKCVNTNDNKIKKNKLVHGQGTIIIKNIVDKYNGVYSFKLKDNLAIADILLSI